MTSAASRSRQGSPGKVRPLRDPVPLRSPERNRDSSNPDNNNLGNSSLHNSLRDFNNSLRCSSSQASSNKGKFSPQRFLSIRLTME